MRFFRDLCGTGKGFEINNNTFETEPAKGQRRGKKEIILWK